LPLTECIVIFLRKLILVSSHCCGHRGMNRQRAGLAPSITAKVPKDLQYYFGAGF
jgi:hypothetical protein